MFIHFLSSLVLDEKVVVVPAAGGENRPSKKAKKAVATALPTYWPKGVGYGSDALPSHTIDMDEVRICFHILARN